MNEANDLEKPEPAAWPGRVDRLVGRLRDCLHGFAELYDDALARSLVAEADDAMDGAHQRQPELRTDVRGDWTMCSIFLPVPNDFMFLAAWARLDGTRLLEWTTQPPAEFPLVDSGNSLAKMD